ncbi:tRNA epoxyqueuosine(34) reductase QueG [Chlorobium sp. N1]|uniref:tRNA epoxyqueuosine(34) reductase QueG n=1 Tax=Chlorobium sp. N1 TaxID=2491138 RepID=UPI00103A747C|nr:tRNA epoxyqueuosine(34) reductase QueG [Chlorobium sp. N1]TCD47606.1 tRNA epoxyqueuosine(34) reductase QueG [Chlorobium sp. N1]
MNTPEPSPSLARAIRREARRLGFSAAGFSAPPPGGRATERFRAMLREERHGEMAYLETGLEARERPELLLPELKTVVSLAMSYHQDPPGWNRRISRYALTADYHAVLRRKAEELLEAIGELAGSRPNACITVDSAPVLEKEWGERSALGRTGKNTLLIVPSAGSYVFLAELLLDMEIPEERPPLPNPCGSCRICLDACPTGALLEPGKLDARRCISYLTGELKREFTTEEASMIGGRLFGCDACQERCPHNQRPLIKADPAFEPREELLGLEPERILGMGRSEFRRLFAGTPILRIGLRRLRRNARAVLANEGKPID